MFSWECCALGKAIGAILWHCLCGGACLQEDVLNTDITDELLMRFLQDAINGYAQYGKTMSEELIMMYTIELLGMVDALHTCGVIHGDIKPDNFLIRNAPKYVVGWNHANWGSSTW